MIKSLVPLLLIAGSFGLYFSYISPAWAEIGLQQKEQVEFRLALQNVAELRQTLISLEERHGAFSSDDRVAMDRMVPAKTDNLQIILDLSVLARKNGVNIGSIDVSDQKRTTQAATTLPGLSTISVTITSRYTPFKAFLADLEKSLQIIDVNQLNVSSGSSETGISTDVAEYAIQLVTYSQG